MTALPEGFRLVLDRSVRSFRHGSVLIGGHPGRLMTLTGDGVDTLDRLLAGAPATLEGRNLGQRLVDAGMAHPRPPGTPGRPTADADVTVVVPVRDRSESLDRCLAALGSGTPVVVVDDASRQPSLVAEVCDCHGARMINRTVNGGPGAARNDGLAVVETELVAFVDSDCTVTDDWLRQLTWMFEDPRLGAVAPRVLPGPSDHPVGGSGSALSRFSDGHSALDMGPDESEVGPDRLVRYVPGAALVVRRAAMAGGFDARLRVGEDVDLVWRLLDAGWRVRYQPATVVRHREPSSWMALLARRYRYGTSAGPLARRHPGRLAPLRLRPWPTAIVASGLAGRPGTALALTLGATAAMARRLRGHGIPVPLALRWSVESAGWTLVGVGHAATMLAAPALAVAALRSRRRALVATLLVLVPPTVEWWRRRPGLDPWRWAAASIADDLAYGVGVWTGSLRSWSFGPLIPSVQLRDAG